MDSSCSSRDENLVTFATSGYSSAASSILDSPQPLSSQLTDAGIYSLCGLVAISFNKLFPDEWHRDFRNGTMQCFIKHLGLPSGVFNTMSALMDGEGGDLDSFVDLLKVEPNLHESCLKVVEDLVLFAVREGVYDARLRVLILFLAGRLSVPLDLVEWYEETVVELLVNELPAVSAEETQAKEKRHKSKKIKRYFMIGLAGLGGGAIIGFTGGLAAPLVAGGVGALIGGTSAAVLGSAAGLAVISSLFGVAGAGLTGYKMKKRVGDVEEFAFETLTPGRQLHVTIAIAGWVTEEGPESFRDPWKSLMNSGEQYAVRYESNYLLELGRALDYFLSFAVSMAAQEALKYTVLASIMAAIAWPVALVTVAGAIDNPWGVCIRRSAEAGKHLADILISRQQGQRPVTLIGFSLGARVIYYCLLEMTSRKGCEGIIQDAVLLGAPVPGNPEQWKSLGRVVSGKLVNGYCRADWLLKFLYRTSSAAMKPAGLDAIDWNDSKMVNVDLSEVVSGHMDYSKNMSKVLDAVGVKTVSEATEESSTMRKSLSFMDATNLVDSSPTKPDSPIPLDRRRSQSDSQLKF
ncbi:Transmembrane and coiled-coil domain-containing protein 4 [Halotydeus destructor]|nr:Transmembrane and coiled-coil domain-containing protein 4 [Halotydeus destructor]